MFVFPADMQPQHVMSVVISIGEDTHTTWADRVRFSHRIARQTSAMPGALSAGTSTNATPPNSGWRQPVQNQRPFTAASQEAQLEFVGSEYFVATLQVPILSGRLWDQSEIARGATLVVVNQSLSAMSPLAEVRRGMKVRLPEFATLLWQRYRQTEPRGGWRSSA